MVDDLAGTTTRRRAFWREPEWVITIVAVVARYDEHWIVADAHAGQHSEWRTVKKYPAAIEPRNDF
jgi:hypothetical protein